MSPIVVGLGAGEKVLTEVSLVSQMALFNFRDQVCGIGSVVLDGFCLAFSLAKGPGGEV